MAVKDLSNRLKELEAESKTGAEKTAPAAAPVPVKPPTPATTPIAAGAGAVRPQLDVAEMARIESCKSKGERPGIGFLGGLKKVIAPGTDLEVGSGLEHLAGPAQPRLATIGSGIRAHQADEKGFMDPRTGRTTVEPQILDETTVGPFPAEKPAVAVAEAEAGAIPAAPAAPVAKAPTPPRKTGNVTADLINLGLYNRRLKSYNQQISAASAAKKVSEQFATQEKRRGATAKAQISESDVRARTSYAGARPKAVDFIEPAEYEAALAQWQKRYDEAPVGGGAAKPKAKKAGTTDYSKYK